MCVLYITGLPSAPTYLPSSRTHAHTGLVAPRASDWLLFSSKYYFCQLLLLLFCCFVFNALLLCCCSLTSPISHSTHLLPVVVLVLVLVRRSCSSSRTRGALPPGAGQNLRVGEQGLGDRPDIRRELLESSERPVPTHGARAMMRILLGECCALVCFHGIWFILCRHFVGSRYRFLLHVGEADRRLTDERSNEG